MCHSPGHGRLRRDELEVAVAAGDPTGVYVVSMLGLSLQLDTTHIIRQDIVVSVEYDSD